MFKRLKGNRPLATLLILVAAIVVPVGGFLAVMSIMDKDYVPEFEQVAQEFADVVNTGDVPKLTRFIKNTEDARSIHGDVAGEKVTVDSVETIDEDSFRVVIKTEETDYKITVLIKRDGPLSWRGDRL